MGNKIDLDKQLESMSQSERLEMLAFLEGYSKVPVTLNEFIDNPYYAGNTLGKSAEGDERVYPYWRNWLNKIYPNQFYSPYQEILITGAIGIGKTTAAVIGISYDLYRLTLIKDPHGKWKLLPTTHIVIALMTASMTLAGTVLGSQLTDLIAASPYFQSIYKNEGQGVIFPNKVGIIQGSRFGHALGQAIISAILDEANFQNAVANQALDNYNSLIRRMQSRFMGENGVLPFRFWILSSKDDSSDFLENHINASRSKEKVCIIEASIWEVHAHKNIYSGKTFRVFVGDENRDPFIVEEEQEIPSYIDDARVINVPIEYSGEFQQDLAGALRDLAGVSSRSSLLLFKETKFIEDAMVVNPAFTSEIILLGEDDSDEVRIANFMTEWLKSIENKSMPRFLHIDTAVSGDRLGIGSVYPISTKAVSRVDFMTGKVETYQEHVFMCELALAIKAKPGSEIPLWKVREFVTALRNEFNFNISRVSTDGFQSVEMRQLLRKQGFETDYISVDRTKDPYRAMKRAVIEQRLLLPKNKLLKLEMKNLYDTGKKIDHPETIVDDAGNRVPGSKDVADAVTGAFWNAQENSFSNQLYADELVSQMHEDNNEQTIFGMTPKEMLMKGLGKFI